MTPLLHEKINTSIKFLWYSWYILKIKKFFLTSCADPNSHLSEEELAAKFILWVNMVGQDAGKVVLLRHKKIQWHHFHWNYGFPALLIPAKIDSPNWSIQYYNKYNKVVLGYAIYNIRTAEPIYTILVFLELSLPKIGL